MFTSAVLDHTLNPRNVGAHEGATHYGQVGDPGGGPYVLMWLTIEEGVVVRASYQTYGCPAVVACASLLCQVAKGRTAAQLQELEERDVVGLLGGLPEGKEHCSALALSALRKGLVSELELDDER